MTINSVTLIENLPNADDISIIMEKIFQNIKVNEYHNILEDNCALISDSGCAYLRAGQYEILTAISGGFGFGEGDNLLQYQEVVLHTGVNKLRLPFRIRNKMDKFVPGFDEKYYMSDEYVAYDVHNIGRENETFSLQKDFDELFVSRETMVEITILTTIFLRIGLHNNATIKIC